MAAKAAKAVTGTIPILFIAGFDPVQESSVASIARPGGNATGVGVYTAELGKKRLELLRDLLPNSDKISMLVNPDSISTNIEIEDLEGAARVQRSNCLSRRPALRAELDKAFDEAVSRAGADALLISAWIYFTS